MLLCRIANWVRNWQFTAAIEYIGLLLAWLFHTICYCYLLFVKLQEVLRVSFLSSIIIKSSEYQQISFVNSMFRGGKAILYLKVELPAGHLNG